MTLHNVNVKNGVASGKGGNVTVSRYGTFRMFGGSLEGGNAKGGTGGNLNVEGIVYLEDVTLTGGKASGSGDNLFMTGDTYEKRINGLSAVNGDVTLNAGKAGVLGTIKADLTMASGTELTNLGLSTDSDIKLTKNSEGTILSDAETDLSGVFTNTDTTGDYVITYDEKSKEVFMDYTVVPVEHNTDHCVCAGADTGLANHTCNTLTGWTEITKDVFETAIGTNNVSQGIKFKENGNYYLSTNYSLTGMLCIMPDQDITICLNGNQLRNGGRCGMIAGKLNITDCVGSGQVYSSNNNTNGNTFKIVAGGELNIYGGTVSSKSSCTDGGVICVSQDKGNIAPASSTEPGVLNLYGGTIKDGSATNGGNVIMWHTSVFNMYGGTISGGTATSGENVRVSNANATANLLGGTIKNGNVLVTAGTLTVGGSVKIDELNLGGNVAQVSDKGLKADANITITAPGTGTLVSGVSESNYSCFSFTDVDSSLTIEYDATQQSIIGNYKSNHNHCICGGVKPAGHSCSSQSWMPLNAKTVGNYFTVGSNGRYALSGTEAYLYLTEDLDLSNSIGLNAGQTLHLCLNGFDLKHTKTANPVMRVWGDLDVTDCSSGRSGSIIGSRTGESPCLYIQNWVTGTQWTTPTVNLFAGTLTADDGNTNSKAGVVQLGNKDNPNGANYATFNMYGGKICGGDATNGGNLYLEGTKAIFNMYGGTITDGNAKSSGGGIYASSASTVNILGGTITGNAAGSLGDDIYTSSSAKVTLGGTVKIGEYYSNSIVLTLQNLNAASSVKLLRNTDASALFATGADTDLSKCFTNPNLTAVWDSAAKTLSFVAGGGTTPPPSQDTEHMHCLCADAAGMPADHKCSDTGFVKLTQADFDHATTDSSPVCLRTEGTTSYYTFADGYYYLDENVTIKKSINMATSSNVSLCLNGKTLTGSGCRTIYTKGVLNITDCDSTKNSDGTHTYKGCVKVTGYTSHAPVLYARTDSTVAIYGGNLMGTKLTTAASAGGGVVCVGGVLNIYEAKISGGDTSATKYNGGNVAIMDGGTINMYAGSIDGGKVAGTQSGGNVRVDKGAFNLYGGTIKGGTAKEGGNIAIGSNGTMHILGGVIDGGRVTDNGGNIAVFGVLKVSGGIIKNGVSGVDGKVDATGGNITTYANKTNITITGGIIENGTAPVGANIAMRTNTTNTIYLTVTGGEIRGGDGKSVNVADSTKVVVTVGGNAKIDCIYLAGTNAKVAVSTEKPITAAASVAIAAAKEQVVVTGAAAVTGFKSYSGSYELVCEGTALKLVAKA